MGKVAASSLFFGYAPTDWGLYTANSGSSIVTIPMVCCNYSKTVPLSLWYEISTQSLSK